MSGRSAAWSAHLPWEQGVGGSNPPVPTSPVYLVTGQREPGPGSVVFLPFPRVYRPRVVLLLPQDLQLEPCAPFSI